MSLDITLLQDSFALVAAKETSLAGRFYELLFERYPQTRAMFRRRPNEQAQMLTSALAAVVAHVDDPSWLETTLKPMGAKHVQYGVTNEMYDWVGECLIAALDEVCGEDFTPAVKATWLAAFGAIASIMQSGAASMVPDTLPSPSRQPTASPA